MAWLIQLEEEENILLRAMNPFNEPGGAGGSEEGVRRKRKRKRKRSDLRSAFEECLSHEENMLRDNEALREEEEEEIRIAVRRAVRSIYILGM